MDKKYFFFDIDGTLVVNEKSDFYVPKSTQKTIEELKKRGHFVAIATGRNYAMAKPVMEMVKIHHMVCDGGNGIVFQDKLIEIRPLDYDLCIQLIQECEEKGFAWGFQPDLEPRRLAPSSRFEEETNDRYIKTIVVENLDPKAYDQIFKVYVACHEPDELTLMTLKKLPWCRYGSKYIFVEPCDKSVGIRRIVEKLGGNIKDVVVFGDGNNDLSMFSQDWMSIAMGNATDLLKEKATYITDCVQDDGIYHACKHFGWI